MKSVKRIILFVIMFIMIITLKVYAANPSIQLSGDSETKVGGSGTITVTLNSESSIGVVSGTISGDLKISDLKVIGQNNWQLLAYNESNGEFKLVKADGAKNEAVMQVTYTIKSGTTGSAKVTLSNINLTTTEYETLSVSDTSKAITITTEKQLEKEETKEETKEEAKEEKDTDKKENEVKEEKKTETVKATNKDNTTASKNLPKTGIKFYIIFGLIIIGVLGVVFYSKVKKYKGI